MPFSQASFTSPRQGDGELWPSECRERALTYRAPLFLTVCRGTAGDAVKTFHKSAGHMPIMVGSSRCHDYSGRLDAVAP